MYESYYLNMSIDYEFERQFKAWFESKSPEEQYTFITPFLLSQNGYVRWRLKLLLESSGMPDLFILLPQELQLKILLLLDDISLLQACQVSKNWNSLVKNCNTVWKYKCSKIGVNVHAKPFNVSWHEAFVSSFRLLHLMKTGSAFQHKFINLQNARKTIKAVDYSDGFLCTVSDNDSVSIWQMELNIPVINFFVDEAVSCIRFRSNSTLICGHFTGILTSWDVKVGVGSLVNRPVVKDVLQMEGDSVRPDNPFRVLDLDVRNNYDSFSLFKMKFSMHSGPVFTCDFNDERNLMVSGSADENIIFWNLLTGQPLFTLKSNSHWVLKVILAPSKERNDLNSHSLLTMTRDCVNRYEWMMESSDTDQPDNIKSVRLVSSYKLNEHNDNFITPGLQASFSYVGLVKQDLQQKQATLYLLDSQSFDVQRTIPLNLKVRKLLALGEEFALLLSVGKELYTSSLIVIDTKIGQAVGTCTIPHSKMTTPDGSQMIIGDVTWLDGLKGWEIFCDKQEILSTDSTSIIRETEHSLPHSTEIGNEVVRENIDLYASHQDSHKENSRGDEAPNRFSTKYSKVSTPSFSSHSMIMAAGVQSEEGKLFTLWWRGNQPLLKSKSE